MTFQFTISLFVQGVRLFGTTFSLIKYIFANLNASVTQFTLKLRKLFAFCEVYKTSCVYNRCGFQFSKVVCCKHCVIGDILSTWAANCLTDEAFS